MTITDGKGIITIRTDGFLSCLIIKRPQVVDWPDCTGSIFRYYACLPYQEESRRIISDITTLVQDIDTIDQFMDSGFCNLLSNGEYNFSLVENEGNLTHIFNSSLFNTNSFVKDHGRYTHSSAFEDTERITKNYYPYKSGTLTYTQPIESLNAKRIKHYEIIIRNGGRPRAIVIRNKFFHYLELEEDVFMGHSANYVLDGHHKLAAYLKLGISPSLIQIDAIRSYNPVEFNYDIISLVMDDLHFCQLSHIISCGFRVDFSKEKHYEKIVDNYLDELTCIESNLLEKFEQGIRTDYPYKYGDITWTRTRIEKLKLRVETCQEPMFLRYHDPKSGRDMRMKINRWEDIFEVVNVVL